MSWAPDYVSAAEAKAFIRVSDTVDDTEIGLWCTAASRAIDLHCNRQFGSTTAEARRYTPRWDRRRTRWVVEIDDVQTTTGFVVTTVDEDGTLVGTITAYDLEPRNAAAKGRPWELLVVRTSSVVVPTGAREEMNITGAWGWTAVPSVVKVAARLQTSRFAARRDSPFGVAGSPQDGSEIRLLSKLDPDVAVSLGPVVRWWAGA